jgi:hypothetical protein
MFRFLGAAVTVLTLSLPSMAVGQTPAEREVLTVIQSFLEGLRTKDTALMKSHLDSLTRFTLLRPAQSGGGVRVFLLSGAEFVQRTTQPGGPTYDEPIRNPQVQIDADLASVWAEYQVRMEGKVTHCGYDSFQLARLNGRWKILNVSDTFRQQGCGEPWP